MSQKIVRTNNEPEPVEQTNWGYIALSIGFILFCAFMGGLFLSCMIGPHGVRDEKLFDLPFWFGALCGAAVGCICVDDSFW